MNAPHCVIVNPLSYRASRRDLAARVTAIASAHGADLIEATRPAEVIAALENCVARKQRRVIVLAGDGTVQAVADHLSGLPAGAAPTLVVLGGGRTNLTAADLGGTGAVLSKLETALKGDRELEVEYRDTLVVEQAPAPPRHGFFVAGAMIESGIRYTHEGRSVGGRLRTGHLSTLLGLLKLAVLVLLRRSPLPEYPHLAIEAGALRLCGPMRVLIASTLLHRTGLFNPYADRGVGKLRVTAVTTRARFWRNLPRILIGSFAKRMDIERGYLSGRCTELKITGLDSYALDGEKFETDPERPVFIRVGPQLAFARP